MLTICTYIRIIQFTLDLLDAFSIKDLDLECTLKLSLAERKCVLLLNVQVFPHKYGLLLYLYLSVTVCSYCTCRYLHVFTRIMRNCVLLLYLEVFMHKCVLQLYLQVFMHKYLRVTVDSYCTCICIYTYVRRSIVPYA
ncbi:hypothetical protein K439DRAFT_1624361 [Ramaria rubella]|nr:hypothetical protein K439DRAFT_1624361 [Ramaria rubella]